MPINFELTFTQPFLAQLDTGQVAGSKTLAKFVTDSYVRTMLTGIPGGGTVPPTLPAPGLATPAGPPPFPIPSVPINNYNVRARAMQRILQTYFEAREILIMNGSIKSTIKSIALIIKKAEVLKQQINSVTRELIEVQRQILQLPELLKQILVFISDTILTEIDKVLELYNALDDFKVKFALNQQQFEATFGNEIQIINTLKNFKITTNINDYAVIGEILRDLEYRLSSLPDATGNDEADEKQFKAYLTRQIAGSLKLIVNVINIAVSPTAYIDFIRDLANFDNKLKPALDMLYRYKYLKEILQPKLNKLQKKAKVLIRKLLDKVNVKIQELKEKLKKKMKDLAAKKQGPGKKSLFLKAGKIVSDFKKKYLKKIKKIRKTYTDVSTIIRLTQNLIVKTRKFSDDVTNFMTTGVYDYFERFKNDVVTLATQPEASARDVESKIDYILKYLGINQTQIRDIVKKQFVGKIISPTVLLEYLEHKPEDLINLIGVFVSLLQDAVDLAAKISELFQGKQQPKTVAVGPPNMEEMSVGEFLVYSIKELQKQLSKFQKKLHEFVRKQEDKLKEVMKKLVNEAKDRLIMLVPLRSDLKDGKTKAEIIQAKKDKIKSVKKKVVNTVKIIRIVNTKLIPGAVKMAQNLENQEWRYTANEQPINNLINGIYDIKIIKTDDKTQKSVLNEKRWKLKNDIRDYLFGFELLVDLLAKIVEDVGNNPEILDTFRQRLENRLTQGYDDLYNKLKELPNLANAKPVDIVRYFEDSYAFRALNKSYVRTMLEDVEKTYFQNARNFLQQFGKNPLLQRIFPGLDVGIDIMLVTVFEGIKKVARLVVKMLRALYNTTIRPVVTKVELKLKKVKDDIEKWLKLHVAKRAANLDLKLMGIAFNLATRAFWTGFSWTTPNGVRYTCTSILPLKPLLAKPDEGASRLVRELAMNLNTQIIGMVGIVSPPPPTGIPPFPFTGYR